MPTADVRWGNGYVTVAPCFPPELAKKLTYWHRSIEWSEEQRKRVMVGESRQLYTEETRLLPDGRPYTILTTMPGFLYRVKQALEGAGWQYTVIDERTPAPKPDLVAAMQGLREYQYEPVYRCLMSGGGVLSAATGVGKTHMMAAIIRAFDPEQLKLRGTPQIIVTTPDKDITRKDYEDLKGMFPDRDVGLLMSGTKKLSDDIQVVTMDSLHLIDPDEVGIIIADEVHAAPTDERIDSIMAMTKALRWGVSATPTGRFDGRDILTEGLFGPVVATFTFQEGVASGALVPIKVYWIPAPEPGCGLQHYNSMVIRTAQYRQGVDKNKAYNQMVAEIMANIPNELQALCIMQHIEQMEQLAGIMPTLPYVHACESQADLTKRKMQHLHALPKADRKSAYDKMATGETRKVMSTYVYKQGVNFPQLTVVVNAGGGGSDIVSRQIPGRASRNIDGKDESYLVDFWHPWDTRTDLMQKTIVGPILKDDKSRRKAYDQLGFEQVWLESPNQLPWRQNV